MGVPPATCPPVLLRFARRFLEGEDTGGQATDGTRAKLPRGQLSDVNSAY
jgi:hypothetical protein